MGRIDEKDEDRLPAKEDRRPVIQMCGDIKLRVIGCSTERVQFSTLLCLIVMNFILYRQGISCVLSSKGSSGLTRKLSPSHLDGREIYETVGNLFRVGTLRRRKAIKRELYIQQPGIGKSRGGICQKLPSIMELRKILSTTRPGEC
jgi:hypothetical protein